MTVQSDFSFKNRILSTLPLSDMIIICPHLHPVDLKQHQVLYDIGEDFESIYFIEQGVASILTTMEDGSSVEAGMVGFEGLTPIAGLLGDKASEQHTVIQLPGHAFKMNVVTCKAIFDENINFRQVVLRFTNSILRLSGQTAACNRLHSLEQRLVRWLLMSSDRLESDILPYTQEYLSIMLGVRRAGVTEAAGELQRSGLIRYHHGHVTITDRTGIEKAACECYCVDQARFKNLFSKNMS